jgi:glycosyltransferase involved in cell wall biosynthesis
LSEWPNIEAVIADDGSDDGLIGAVLDWQQKHDGFTVKYVASGDNKKRDYGLARARNMAAIEAEGEFLMFCDSRMLPDPKAINLFMDKMYEVGRNKAWLFGDKGGGKDSFVENFSFIRRSDFIKAGMCNERIDRYGGMSQELRERFSSQGFKFVYVPEATATQMKSSRMSPERRKDIIDTKFKLYKMGL